MANQIGGMITLFLTPILADRFGWNVCFSVAAVVAGFGAIAWLFIQPGITLSPSGSRRQTSEERFKNLQN
jgi:dipeptide/tripeptide permease